MGKIIWDTSQATKIGDSQDLAEALLLSRGLSKLEREKFFNPSYPGDLQPPDLPNIGKAVKRIVQAINKDEQIVIYGDYDIDGLSATALLYDFLTKVGAKVATFIPDRFEQGYGLHASSLLDLQSQGTQLVITVDCGTTATEALKAAAEHKLDVVVTDHHTPPAKLPEGAVAIVNPKLSDEKGIFNEFAGVGVAFYLCRAILLSQPKLLVEGQEKWLLDLVALGTVCDVVPLVEDNRVLVRFGLKVLQKTRRIGLRALAEVSGVEIGKINESDIGFRLGPRLNAAGRLENAQKALELLTTNDVVRATKLAVELNGLNAERQVLTQEIYEAADKQASKYKSDPLLVLSNSDWSHGVVGIVAARLSEKWHKPVILFQELGDKTKGSARSFNTFNIIKAITACSESLTSFGGHAFAAGISLPTDRVEEFRYRLNQYAMANMDPKNNFKTIQIAGDYGQTKPELKVLDNLVKLAPFGNANNEPLFCGVYQVCSTRLVGQKQNHVQLKLGQFGSPLLSAIAFRSADKWPWLIEGMEAEFAFRLQRNVWQGIESLQLEIIDVHQLD